MPIKLFFLSWVIFEIIVDFEQFTRFRFDKVSLNAVSCQTADSIVFIHTSKETELKGLKSNDVPRIMGYQPFGS